MVRMGIGILLGAVVTAALMGAFSPDPPAHRTERPTPAAPSTAPTDRADPDPETPPRPSGVGDRVADTMLPSDRILLRIGEGFVFGESRVRSPGDSSCDIVCQDIRYGASLHCPHGAAAAQIPVAAVDVPREAATLAARVPDAPRHMPSRDVWLRAEANKEQSGVGLVRARDGTSYRLHLVSLEPAAHALERRVTIAYESVPSRPGGGVVTGATAARATQLTNTDLRAYVAIARSVPGMNSMEHLDGEYVVIEKPTPEMVFRRKIHVVESDPFGRSLTLKGRGAFVAAGGIAPGGKVVLDSYSAVLSRGPMAGTIDVESYGFVHIEGDLTGTLNINSYTSAIVDGDIVGVLKVRSYTKLLLRGRVQGALDAKGSCWSTFFFESFHGRAELEGMGDHFKSVTLHVKQSDLPAGTHKGIGSWRTVIVADDVWTKIKPRR